MNEHDKAVRVAAHRFADMGWKLIPLDPRTNEPMIALEDATSDHGEIDVIFGWAAAMQAPVVESREVD